MAILQLFSEVFFEVIFIRLSWFLLSYTNIALVVEYLSFFFYTVFKEYVLGVKTASRKNEALHIAETYFGLRVKLKYCSRDLFYSF